AVGERLGDRFGAGIAFVPLAAVTQPELVLEGVARAVGAELAGAGSPLEALGEYFGDDRWLLILDNLEQVGDAARDIDALLARCRGVGIPAARPTAPGRRAGRGGPGPPPAAARRPRRGTGGGAGGLARGGAVRGPRRGGAPRLHPHRGQRGGGGGDLPAAGGPAAGDRAGGCPHPATEPGRATAPAGQV